MKTLSLVCILFLVVGCTPSPPAPVVEVQSTPLGEEVPKPEFENWNRFQVGTKVVRRKTVTNPNGTVVETEALKLIAKTDSQVEVESQIFVKRHDGTEINNPPQTWIYPAKFRLPPNMTINQFKLPSLKAKLTGNEKVKVEDEVYQADVYEWTEVNEAGPMTVKLLVSEEFPGYKLQQEMFTEQTQTRSVEVIAEFAPAK